MTTNKRPPRGYVSLSDAATMFSPEFTLMRDAVAADDSGQTAARVDAAISRLLAADPDGTVTFTIRNERKQTVKPARWKDSLTPTTHDNLADAARHIVAVLSEGADPRLLAFSGAYIRNARRAAEAGSTRIGRLDLLCDGASDEWLLRAALRCTREATDYRAGDELLEAALELRYAEAYLRTYWHRQQVTPAGWVRDRVRQAEAPTVRERLREWHQNHPPVCPGCDVCCYPAATASPVPLSDPTWDDGRGVA